MTYKVNLYKDNNGFFFTEEDARAQIGFIHCELYGTPMWDELEDHFLAEKYSVVEREVRYIKVECDAGYAGTDAEEYVMLPAEWTDEQIDDYANEYALCNAEIYSYLVEQDYEDEDEETYIEVLNDYYAEYGCGAWHEISPEEWEEESGIVYVR